MALASVPENASAEQPAAAAPRRERPNLYEEAHDMVVISTAMFFLGKMRKLAREGAMPDVPSAAAIMTTPITIDQIYEAIAANWDVLHDLEGMAKFGKDERDRERVRIHSEMLRTSLRQTMTSTGEGNPRQTWEITDFADERSEEELVYAIFVDDLRQRIVVGFRGSITKRDWTTNFDATQTWVDNPLFGSGDDGSGMRQPKKLVMHRGFQQYVFDPNNDANETERPEKTEKADAEAYNDATKISTTKFDAILQSTIKALEEHPGYDLYTTGLSLGGALTTVFALHAAASDDPRIPKPVTCYNYGSPKVGAMSFRKAFHSLEESGKLRCVRVANEGDPVKELPYGFYRHLPYLSLLTYTHQRLFYRHVGMRLFLHQEGGYSFEYPDSNASYGRQLWDDLSEQDIMTRQCFRKCCTNSASASDARKNHGYPAYLHRLEANRDGIRTQDVDELYKKAAGEEAPCLCCPLFCPRPKPKDGDMRRCYY